MSMASTKSDSLSRGKPFSAEWTRSSEQVGQGFAIGSEHLPSLLEFIENQDGLKQLIGALPTFVVVVDANVLIGDLLWLSVKRRNVLATPALMECILAKTMIVRVTATVVGEVERAMDGLARKHHIPDEVWRSHWAKYKPLLLIEDPNPIAVARFANGRDPTDAPTLALAESETNCGILTKDRDLKAMGGKVLPLEFKLEVRNYSRKAATFVSLQIGGYCIFIGTIGAFRMAVGAMKEAIEYYRALPVSVKLLLIAGLLLLLLHPKSRSAIAGGISRTAEIASKVVPPVLGGLIQAAKVAQDNRPVPPVVRHI